MIRVVVVDNDPDDADFLCEVIGEVRNDIRCEVFYNPIEAVDTLLHETILVPDLIITDLNMPMLNGFELCRILRLNKAFDHVNICVISTTITDKVAEALEEIGINCHYKKPWTKEGYIEIVEQLLKQVSHISS